MFCLAGVGGRVKGIMVSTRPRQQSLPSTAARWTVRRRWKRPGSPGLSILRLSDIGIEKGKSPVTEDRISKVVRHGKNRLAESRKVG